MPADQDASKGYDPTAESTTTATAVRSSRPGKRSRLPRGSPRASKRQRRRRCASRVTRSPSRNRSGCLRQRLRHARLARPPAGRRGRASRSVQRTKHRRSKDIEYRVEARIDEHSEDVQLKQSTLDETYNRRVESNEPTTPSGLRPRARSRPRAASTHEHKCSSRCAFVSLLRSPTTNAETIQEAPSSRYENYSMTPSDLANRVPWKKAVVPPSD